MKTSMAARARAFVIDYISQHHDGGWVSAQEVIIAAFVADIPQNAISKARCQMRDRISTRKLRGGGWMWQDRTLLEDSVGMESSKSHWHIPDPDDWGTEEAVGW